MLEQELPSLPVVATYQVVAVMMPGEELLEDVSLVDNRSAVIGVLAASPVDVGSAGMWVGIGAGLLSSKA